jgi:aspartyl/asparaginyl beta-hydroxylase (cupin superfamily)
MFYNPESFPWLNEFQIHFNEIKDELLQIKNLPKKPLYENTWGKEDRPTYLNKDENENAQWDTFVFKFFTIKHLPNMASCPKTATLIERFPQIITAEFSLIKPNTHILPHTGYSNKYKRAHLGIIIPEGEMGLKVENETKKWKPNQWLVFDDSKKHEAWNNTSSDRVVLMIDFVDDANKAKGICKDILTQTNDPYLLSIAPKDKWLEWLEASEFPVSNF